MAMRSGRLWSLRLGFLVVALLVGCSLSEDSQEKSDEGSSSNDINYRPTHSSQSYAHSKLAAATSVSWLWYVQRQTAAARRRQERGCWSHKEQRYYYHAGGVLQPSEQFVQSLSSYHDMHARCSNVSDWSALMHQVSSPADAGDGAVPPLSLGCRYLIFKEPLWNPVANRLLSLVSAFTYALLTNRTLLVQRGSFTHRFLCNPFPRSHDHWALSEDDFSRVESQINAVGDAREAGQSMVRLHVSWNSPSSHWWVFCESLQQQVASIPLMTFYTIYSLIPGFYLVPSFQRQLDSLFPDRRVFTHVARHLLHPANHLWDRITRLFHGNVAHHPLKMGVMTHIHDESPSSAALKVINCSTITASLLPAVMPWAEWRATAAHPSSESLLSLHSPVTSVLLVSKDPHLLDSLRAMLTRGKPMDGSVISMTGLLYPQPQEEEDRSGYEQQLVDLWLLSFSDSLIVTSSSTDAYLAAGLAGIRPYAILSHAQLQLRQQEQQQGGVQGSSVVHDVCVLSSSQPPYEQIPEPQCAQESPSLSSPSVHACTATDKHLCVQVPEEETSGNI